MKFSPFQQVSQALRLFLSTFLFAGLCFGQAGTTRIRQLIVQDPAASTNFTSILDNFIQAQQVSLTGQDSTPELVIESLNGNGNVTIQVANDATPPWTLLLPPDNGDAGEVLTTNGSGVATWEPGGGATVGAAGEVQFTDGAGAHLSDTDLVFTTDTLFVTKVDLGNTTGTYMGATSANAWIWDSAFGMYFNSTHATEINLDTDNNASTASFAVRHDNATRGLGALLFRVNESGDTDHGGDAIPTTNEAFDLGTTSLRWGIVYQGTGIAYTQFRPDVNLGADIGGSTLRFNVGYFGSVDTPAGATASNMNTILARSAISSDLGSTSLPWANIYAAVAVSPDTNLGANLGSSSLTWNEIYTDTIFVDSLIRPTSSGSADSGQAARPWNQVFADTLTTGGSSCDITAGAGAPGGACTTCDVFLRIDGGSGTTLYVCESSSWTAK